MIARRPYEEEGPDEIDRLRPTAVDDGFVTEQYLAWELAMEASLNRMPWVRFVWVKGGRRIRKTDYGIKRLIRKALRRPPGSDLGYINRTIKQGKITAWKRMKRKFQFPNNWLLEGQPNENALSIPLIGGRTIYIIGSEDIEAARGFEFSDVLVDEASVNQNLPQLMKDVIEPMLSDKTGTADFIMTSRGKGYHYQQHQKGCAWLLDEHGERYRNDKYQERYVSVTVPTPKVGMVPPDDLERMEQEMGPEIFGQEFLCHDLDYVGLAVHQFVRQTAPDGNILPLSWYEKLREHLTFFGVIDYARSSGTTVREVFGVDSRGRPIFIDEMVLPGGDPARVAGQVRQQDERLGVQTLVNICGRDCWHKESNRKAMAEQLISRGIQCQPCSFSLVDAVGELNRLCRDIQDADFDPGGDGLAMFLVLEGRCPKLVYQFCSIEHADLEKKSQNMKDALDCARMAVMMNYRALPGRRILPPAGLRRNRIEELLAIAGGGRAAAGARHPISGRRL